MGFAIDYKNTWYKTSFSKLILIIIMYDKKILTDDITIMNIKII